MTVELVDWKGELERLFVDLRVWSRSWRSILHSERDDICSGISGHNCTCKSGGNDLRSPEWEGEVMLAGRGVGCTQLVCVYLFQSLWDAEKSFLESLTFLRSLLGNSWHGSWPGGYISGFQLRNQQENYICLQRTFTLLTIVPKQLIVILLIFGAITGYW